MFVANLRIDAFRHLSNVQIGPLSAPSASTPVVPAGPNGGGKSSVLEVLSYALSSSWGWGYQVRRNFPNASFEVTFGLSEGDLAVIRDRVADNPAMDSSGVLSRLETERTYVRSFNVPNGQYSNDPSFHEGSHALVASALRDRMKALFLQSDRYYPAQGYNKNRYWDSSQRRSFDYLRSLSFMFTERQFAEQMEFLIETAYDYPRVLGTHLLETRAGTTIESEPADPLTPYEQLFQRLYPQYELLKSTRELQDQLRVVLPDGTSLPFSDLSSGEREVFFLLTFFVRYAISDSMVFIDEPELHLHPELARRLVQLMLATQPGNQIWLATHNAELIAEAGRDRTYFILRPAPTEPATSRRAADEPESVELMRSIFGFGGYVGLARRIVFLEGDSASADRETFTQLFPSAGDELRFVPLNSADNILRINRAALAILGETIGHTEFLLIRDRDYLTDEEVAAHTGTAGGRLFVLRRHEIENYLLDLDAIAEVTRELTGNIADPTTCAAELKELCRAMSGQVLKSLVTARLNRIFQPQDCSIGGFEATAEWLDTGLEWNAEIVSRATGQFVGAAAAATGRVMAGTTTERVAEIVSQAQATIRDAFNGLGWRNVFPGKELLASYQRNVGLGRGPALQNALIRNLAFNRGRIDAELVTTVETALGHDL
jgi:hypothetical protein